MTSSPISSGDPTAPTVSALVVSYHTGEVLFACLAALRADTAIAEILVVDNGNPPDVRGRLEALADARVKLVGEGRTRGFAAGVNLGARAASGSRLLILNPDAILRPGAVAALEAALREAAEPAVIGGKIVGEDGREQRGGRRRRLTLATLFGGLNLNTAPEPEAPVRVGAVSGALMYLSRAGFDALQGFDEGYFLHVEDIDICRRAEEAGGAVIYTPFAVALHHGATSNAPRREVERHKAAGFRRYFAKFARTPAERFGAAMIAPLLGLALQARVLLRGGGA